MSAAPLAWRPLYDADESAAQYAARQKLAFAAFELAWREGRVSLKLKGYYDQLVRDVGANAYAWWTEERWAAAFGVSASTIKRVLAALTKAGLIRRERQFGSSSRTFLTVYDRDAAPVEEAQQCEREPATEQAPEAGPQGLSVGRHQVPEGSFFGTTPEPAIGSLLHRDHVKNRHLTIGAAGGAPPAPVPDVRNRQILEREGVVDFVLAPQLAHQAAGELEAVSQYLDTQHSVHDRPRLFAWLATHGFGRQLLATRRGRTTPSGRAAHPRAPTPTAQPRRLDVPVGSPMPHAPVWCQAIDRLRAEPLATDLQLWMEDLVLLDLTATTAVVGTPNVLVRDAVATHTAVLAAALAQVLGHSVDVMVVVDGCR